MNVKKFFLINFMIIIMVFPICFSTTLKAQKKSKPKKVYFSFTLHGNMNYDRYPASTIWEKFPDAYQNVLDFIEEHPDFKGQMQLSGQTYKTMQIVHPDFLEQTKKLYEKGQIDVTGTFYSEPVNVCMDGETNLFNAWLGTTIIRNEMVEPSGFFLQEYAYNPQLPYILNQANVDWVPVRMTDFQYYTPFYLVGLDGSKIPAIQEVRKHSRDNYERLIQNAPENAIFLIGGDYEIPERFIDGYNEVKKMDEENEDIIVEWIRVRDYIKKFPPKGEVFVNNSDLAGIENWDSYSRWTTDPYDIEVHTLTKKAMLALRAAKMAVFAGTEFARIRNIEIPGNPDRPIEELESFEIDRGIDWDIEHASSYPDVEPGYLKRGGEVTLLSQAEHLLAWAVNSDSRGWWPLYERREERMESLQRVIDICEELVQNSLETITLSVSISNDLSRAMAIFNAEKARNTILEITAGLPLIITDAEGKEYVTKIFRRGNDYILRANIDLPAYGYKVIGLKYGGKVETPVWEEGLIIENNNFKIEAKEDHVLLTTEQGTSKITIDPFQLKVLAEMIFIQRNKKDWYFPEQYGPTRVSVCTNDIYPKIRIDRQIDWAVHLRQEYELREDHINSKWRFFMTHPTLIRKDGSIDKDENDVPLDIQMGKKREMVFKPEGLMARIETGRAGKVFYDVPYGITDQDYPDPSYVTMLNFSLLQQDGHGLILMAKTGSQAVGVDQEKGSMALALGASNGSGPVRNPEMKVNDLTVFHERPMYAETFKGEYNHEFAIYPFEGSWQEINPSKLVRSIVNGPYIFETEVNKASSNNDIPSSASLIKLDNEDVEITSIDKKEEFFIRLNERTGNINKGNISVGNWNKPFSMTGFEIKKVELK
jgi:hypothetical protein